MKNWIISSILLLLLNLGWSQQFPEGISYQAQIFDSNGSLISASTIGVKFTLRSGSLSGPVIWDETHTVMTSSLGGISLEIGT